MMNLTVVEDCLLIGSSTDIECGPEDDYRNFDTVASGYRRITVSNTGGFNIGSR